jgi:hypothetical protein
MHLLSNSDIPIEVVLQNDSREEVLLYGTADSVEVRSPALFQLFASSFLTLPATGGAADSLDFCKRNPTYHSFGRIIYLIIRQAIYPVNLQLAQRGSENHSIFAVRIVR